MESYVISPSAKNVTGESAGLGISGKNGVLAGIPRRQPFRISDLPVSERFFYFQYSRKLRGSAAGMKAME
jgi:hypothetical protein